MAQDHEIRVWKRRVQMLNKRTLRDVYNPFLIGDDIFKLHYRYIHTYHDL